MSSSFTRGFDVYDDDDDGRAAGEEDQDKNQTKGNHNNNNAAACYHFTPKHQNSIKNNPLCGIRLMPWLMLLYHRRRFIDWQMYWRRILFLTFMSIINSILAVPERILYGLQIQNTPIHNTPIFIIGHPRTGTTLLHGLLALADHERFAICDTFCAGFVHCFLWFENYGRFLFQNVMDKHRPMDQVQLSFDLPQEDELAVTVLTGGISGYMALYFMNQERSFRPYYAFEEPVDEPKQEEEHGMDPADLAAARRTWTTAFLHLCRKLSLRDGNGTKRLLLKSPVHTARIQLLLSLFPHAKFIYLHRNPYDIFRSACHMADTTYWYTYLQVPADNHAIQEFILRQYEILWYFYERDRNLFAPDQLVEVAYDDLTQDPVETVKRIYATFGWSDDFDTYVQDRIAHEAVAIAAFPVNRHENLSPELCRLVETRWGPSFERLGYSNKKIGRGRDDDVKREEKLS
jgi:omega-hydroxy-beta-dihydromenaquinone-9 sulfotransferase